MLIAVRFPRCCSALSYPAKLFSGLTRENTTVNVDLGMLYSGSTPIPPGLFDDVTGSVGYGSGVALTGQSQVNQARGCGYIVQQKCLTCPDGTYLNSISGMLRRCARAGEGASCGGGSPSCCSRCVPPLP